MIPTWLILTAAGQFSSALLFFPALRLERRPRLVVLIALAAIFMLFPLAMPVRSRLDACWRH